MVKEKKETKSKNSSEPSSKPNTTPVPQKKLPPIIKVSAKDMDRPWYKNPILWFIIAFFVVGAVSRILFVGPDMDKKDFGTFLSTVKENNFEKLEIKDTTAILTPKDKNQKTIYTVISNQTDFRKALSELEISPTATGIEFSHPSNLDIVNLLSTVAMIVFIGIIIYSFFSAKNMAAGPMMGFGDSKAKLFIGLKQQVKFDKVKGVDEALDEVKEIVEFLKTPQKFLKLGARIPKGVLLVGPPGTGKTLLARAIAGEAGVPFFFTSGSEFEEMLVGAGASRVRDLFMKAKKAAPAIIFIDEIDSIARKRGMVVHSGNSEQTLNQILVEMDGFDPNTNIIVIAATNRPDVLDPALLRPGRFDRRVMLELPDLKGREEILKIYTKNKPLSSEVDLPTIAKRTIGFSGADLENMVNEAAINAAKSGRKEILSKDLEEAANKVTLGPAKKRVKSEREKKIAAYHEAGHAIAGYFTKGADKVHRIDIVSRGFTGGVTMYLPDEDEYNLRTEEKFKAELITLFGGRSAEKIFFDTVTTGASSDIKRATQIARDMVKKYGMSKLGYISYDEDEQEYTTTKLYSEKTSEDIDKEVSRIIAEASKESEKILRENKDKLDELGKLLMQKEAIESDEFYKFMEESK